jgi:hypothetical protein
MYSEGCRAPLSALYRKETELTGIEKKRQQSHKKANGRERVMRGTI